MIRRFVMLALLLAPLPAWAHARLVSATPAVGVSVPAAPTELVLRFSEALELRFSTVTVQDAAGARVDKGDLHAGPDGAKSLGLGLNALRSGEYTVTWQVLSVDTHRSEGRFRFQIAP